MANQPKRVAVIGFDCPIVPLLEQYVKEGYLPNFKKVFEAGVFAEQCLVPFPTITPPNWTTIATGALDGTHQITDFWMQKPGEAPNTANSFPVFDTKWIKAQSIWEAIDEAGKKAVVLNWPTSWPSRMKNGILIGGAGLTPVDRMIGPGATHKTSFCGNQLITTGIYPNAVRGEFEPAEEWQNLTEPGEEPLELAAQLAFPNSDDQPAPTTWYVLARQSKGEGYDTVTLSPSKDFSQAFCTLKLKEWSPKIWTKVQTVDGREREVFFRCKLLELSEDAEEFRLWVTALVDQTPLCSKPEVLAKVVAPEGVPVPDGGLVEAMLGLIDLDTFAENSTMYSQYLAEVATSLLKDGDWDGFFMHSHPPDFTYHYISSQLDPLTNPDPVSRQAAWDCHLKVYLGQDKMLGQILDILPEDTLTVLVSDHGAVADGATFDPFSALVPAGLTAMEQEIPDPASLGAFDLLLYSLGQLPLKYDSSRTQAIASGSCYVYVNLKGRDPEGIVDPADYEKTQLKIIDALLTYVDPKTGQRPVALALTKQDARILGLFGERFGDVVYAVYPWYSSQHGPILPTAKWGIGDVRGLWVLKGEGIKQGVRLSRTVGLQDLVPTICYATGLPLPRDVDGAVVFQAFEDPNFKQKEVAALSDALAKMEAALSGKQE